MNDGDGHFLVILAHHLGSYLILDPPNEPTWITGAELWKSWDGLALHIARRPDQLPRRQRADLAGLLTVAGVGLMVLSCLILLPRKHAQDVPADRRSLAKESSTLPLQMVCTASVAFLAASFLCGDSSPWAGHRSSPRLMNQLVKKRIDASSAVDPGVRVPFQFQLLNPQSFDIKVDQIVTSCGCATPSLGMKTVKAGQSTDITIQVKPPEKASTPRSFDFTISFEEPSRNPSITGQGILELER